jgi:hypothetical protein
MRHSNFVCDKTAVTLSVVRAHSKIITAVASSFIALSCCAPHALAQTISGSAQSDSLQEIVVTAGRREELLGNVGVGISAVTGADLDRIVVTARTNDRSSA